MSISLKDDWLHLLHVLLLMLLLHVHLLLMLFVLFFVHLVWRLAHATVTNGHAFATAWTVPVHVFIYIWAGVK